MNSSSRKRVFFIWVFTHCLVYLLLSILMGRSMFDSETDGFYYQILSVSGSGELGVLSIMHKLRYYLVYPFYFCHFNGLPSIIQFLLLLIYIRPVFVVKASYRVKFISILLLYFSLFFSYRSVLVMMSIYILVLHIHFTKIPKKTLFLAFLYSLLSTGTLLIFIVLISFFKNKFFQNKKVLKYFKYYSLFLMAIIIGPMAHKLLFFIDPAEFGKASSVTLDAILNISYSDLIVLYQNLMERSMLGEAIEEDNYIRLTIVGTAVFLMITLFLVSSRRIVRVFLGLLLVSLFFEGLMTFSLFFSIIILFYDFIYRSIKRTKNEARYSY